MKRIIDYSNAKKKRKSFTTNICGRKLQERNSPKKLGIQIIFLTRMSARQLYLKRRLTRSSAITLRRKCRVVLNSIVTKAKGNDLT